MTGRADDNGPFKAFDFGDWFSETMQDCWREPKCGLDETFGAEFRAHMRQSFREQLVAVRDALDTAIEKLERPERSRQV